MEEVAFFSGMGRQVAPAQHGKTGDCSSAELGHSVMSLTAEGMGLKP